MYRSVVTTFAAIATLFASSLGVGFHARVEAAEPVNAAAVAAIEKLGGWAREVSIDSEDWEVEFSLGGEQLTDEGLVHVAGLKNIVSLNLKGTKITSAGLTHLKGLTKLRSLHLEKTKIGDEGTANLKGLVNLRYLNLYATNVTDKTLEHLTGLKKLRRLYLWQTGVTDQGVAMLEKALPELTIERGVDFSKLPAPPPRKPAVPLKWIAATDTKAPKSKTGPNTSVTFKNKSGRRVKIYWVGYDAKLQLYGELDPNATRYQNTYAGATWLITDENDKPLGHFRTGRDESLAVITSQK